MVQCSGSVPGNSSRFRQAIERVRANEVDLGLFFCVTHSVREMRDKRGNRMVLSPNQRPQLRRCPQKWRKQSNSWCTSRASAFSWHGSSASLRKCNMHTARASTSTHKITPGKMTLFCTIFMGFSASYPFSPASTC